MCMIHDPKDEIPGSQVWLTLSCNYKRCDGFYGIHATRIFLRIVSQAREEDGHKSSHELNWLRRTQYSSDSM